MNQEKLPPHLGPHLSQEIVSTMMTTHAQIREEEKKVHLEESKLSVT